MGHVGAVAVDDEAVGLHPEHARHEHLALVDDGVGLIELVGKPVERDVGSEHGHHPTRLVVDGHHIGRQRGPLVIMVVERCRPLCRVGLEDGEEPIGAEIVANVIGPVLGIDGIRAVWVAPGVGTVLRAFLRIIVFNETDAAAPDARTASHDALHGGLVVVGIVERLLQIIEVVGHGHIDIGDHTTGVLVGDEHLVMVDLGIELACRLSLEIEQGVGNQQDDDDHPDQHPPRDFPSYGFLSLFHLDIV